MNEDSLERKKEILVSYLKQESDLLRDVLGLMLEERDALLSNKAEELKALSARKDKVVESLLSIRDQSKLALQCLKRVLGGREAAECSLLEIMDEFPEEDFSSITLYKDTVESLLEKIQAETLRNEYLIKNKVSITRDMIHRLQGDQSPNTYSPEGRIQSKNKKVKVALINREV